MLYSFNRACIFLNRKVNYIIYLLSVILSSLGTIIDFLSFTSEPEDIIAYITNTQIGTSTLFTSILFVYNLDRFYKKKIAHVLIITTQKKKPFFEILLSFCFIVALSNLLVFIFTTLALDISTGFNYSFYDFILSIFKYFIASIFYNLIFSLLYFISTNIFITLFSFFLIYFIDRKIYVLISGDNNLLPLNILYTFITKTDNAIGLIFYLVAFITFLYYHISSRKRWN